MRIQRSHVVATGVVVVVVVVVIIAATVSRSKASSSSRALSLPHHLNASQCPASYGSPRPLIVVSLDGYRPEYLLRNLTPSLTQLSQRGVFAPYLLPVYPTKTFTNHYSIVTGLYPESHGIVDNAFYDPTFKALFTLRSPGATNGSWWDGEPIWNTLARQGKKSATFFWPGSEADIGGRHPSMWIPFDDTISYSHRVSQVLKWVSLPPEERPSWVSLYLEEPDKQGHATGPQSSEVDGKLGKVEEAVRELVQGLVEGELLHCVNLLFVSDHGMAQRRPDAALDLATSVPELSQVAQVFFGATARIMLKEPNPETELEVVRRLSHDFKGKLRVFLKTDLPKRLHYVNNPRISPVVLDLTPGYAVQDVRRNANAKKRPPPQGLHGYDYIHPDLAAIFVGYGPDLVQGKTVEPFQNIELYNLMCMLAGVEPAPNNGTWGALHHLLAHPPPLPTPTQPVEPILREYPESANNIFQLAEGCEAHPNWTSKQRREDATLDTLSDILPWGPLTTSGGEAAPFLLLHKAHATGYSQEVKAPLWTSFMVHGDSLPTTTTTTTTTPWITDPRLSTTQTATCWEYDKYFNNITMTPLFPPRYRSAQVPEEAYFITNAVGITDSKDGVLYRWQHLTEDLLAGWVTKHGALNVVLGPVFDHNHDGLLDSFSAPAGSLRIPSDLFAVLTRCLDKVTSLTQCDPSRLDAIAFVYPQIQHSWEPDGDNGLSFAFEYTARVKDVELLTNLTFFPTLAPEARLPLLLRTHRSLWLLP